MAVRFGKLYDALCSAGADDVKARHAVEEMTSARSGSTWLGASTAEMRADLGVIRTDLAQIKTDTALLKWMGGVTSALLVTILAIVLRGLH